MMGCLTASRGTRGTHFDSDLDSIVYAFRQWRGELEVNAKAQGRQDAKKKDSKLCDSASLRLSVCSDIPGFCKAETIAGIGKHGFVLTPGRYVGAEAQEDDGEPFAEKYPRLLAELEECFGEGERLMGVVRERLGGLSNGS